MLSIGQIHETYSSQTFKVGNNNCSFLEISRALAWPVAHTWLIKTCHLQHLGILTTGVYPVLSTRTDGAEIREAIVIIIVPITKMTTTADVLKS